MNAYYRLMRLDKPIGIYLLLWPTLWALFLAADGFPDVKNLLIFIVGTILMRSAGCVINDYADRKIDKLVERTQQRPITSGEVLPKSALVLFFVMMLLAFVLVLLTNILTIQLAIIAGALATLYPFTKRWTHLPQFVLGVAFAMSVPMVFAATNGFVPMSAWWLFLATIIWTVIYDTMYAMADREEDLKIGVKSTAILFAKYDRFIIAILQILLLLTLIQVSKAFNLDIFYDISLAIVAVLMIFHQKLIKNREKNACFQAFLHNNFIGMAIFIGIASSVTL
ncbi:4-hydroxybenzoate octaprenyltransferase [Bathymodiolus septemdierum thioautotrophic gill symbiont]|uniref:4-hydroxybenzoate octaprenyltransferase n=1 Tax=endosymbiont of Bathymodiolus septemdierum str. Myojin knoll TaxID=1303921 RepID=A0A0P0UPN3_9GAMM|nr:4-hydroxybenzoate octaprenyltransferase [Bathymodiolus septemdierum thioautotrophic gill symbiont]BAS67132.1 4-hydroxybenzoate octaprenyltransferase [endosymbiont of Bathymodiolus septemdierum str. Myojin knoll]